jgi:3-methyladenine DNA glycosylase AlkD
VQARAPTTKEITAHLQSLADPVRAAHSQRYFKTAPGEYGAGDKFLGISPWHEIRLFALLLLVARYDKGGEAEREAIYTLYFKLTRHINNWDLVDTSAPYIVGRHLLDKDRTVLYQLARSESLWERRIAIMASAWFIRAGQYHDTLRLAEMLLNDREDLIHKATGWMLREIGKRDYAAEVAFLDAHDGEMPRTMLRYAIERFGEEDRRRYLAEGA